MKDLYRDLNCSLLSQRADGCVRLIDSRWQENKRQSKQTSPGALEDTSRQCVAGTPHRKSFVRPVSVHAVESVGAEL